MTAKYPRKWSRQPPVSWAHLPQCQGHLTDESRKRGGAKSAAKRKAKAIAAYAPLAADICP